jgi:hypothetical protein
MFDETVFPFSHTSVSPTTPSSTDNLLLHSDHFVDAAYTPILLANHGAGLGCGARLELLDEDPSSPPVDQCTSHADVDLHAPHADMDPLRAPASPDQRPRPASPTPAPPARLPPRPAQQIRLHRSLLRPLRHPLQLGRSWSNSRG